MATAVLLWNPEISNFKTKDFKKLVRNFYKSYKFNWEVWEHEKVHVDDRFIWVMCGEGKTGVVGMGYFRTNPYEGDDWSPKGIKRWYAEMKFEMLLDPDKAATLGTKELTEKIPGFEWNSGHSGRVLSEKQTVAFENLWAKFEKEHTEQFDGKGAMKYWDYFEKRVSYVRMDNDEQRYEISADDYVDCEFLSISSEYEEGEKHIARKLYFDYPAAKKLCKSSGARTSWAIVSYVSDRIKTGNLDIDKIIEHIKTAGIECSYDYIETMDFNLKFPLKLK